MHTPGPWMITKHNNRIEIKQNTDEWSAIICHVYTSGVVNGNFYKMPSKDNAQLIATAPELLESLEEVLQWVNETIPEDIYKCAEIAIAKAKGEA